jgi:hypothetical protein
VVGRAPVRFGLYVSVVDQDRDAAGAAPGLHVSPSNPDRDARPEVDGVPGRGLDEEPRARLPGLASVGVIVIADEQIVER